MTSEKLSKIETDYWNKSTVYFFEILYGGGKNGENGKEIKFRS